jgi:hypothetical protein
MRNLIQQLAGVSRDQLQRMNPSELAALIRQCERIVLLTQGRAVNPSAQQRIDRIEPEDYPDA